MYFMIAAFIIATACTVITVRTLVGYSDLRFSYKAAITLGVTLSWFAPVWIGALRCLKINDGLYVLLSNVGYYLFGLAFILFCMLMLRDVLWYLFYGGAKLLHLASWNINPKNINVLNHANLITLALSLAISFYALYEGLKLPSVREVNFYTPKISSPYRIVLLSDLHITRAVSAERIARIVEKVNALEPDVIVMPGDILDDKVGKIEEQLHALGGLRAKYGVYASIGNHEFYSGINPWLQKFREMGFTVLFNHGKALPGTGLFLAGIPDLQTAMSNPGLTADLVKAFKGSDDFDYRILLSHNPEFIDYVPPHTYDLQLSAHTHGGQIFPFHYLVWMSGNYLAGTYRANEADLYVSRGAGYWGPAMRLLAPSEITLITLYPENGTPKK